MQEFLGFFSSITENHNFLKENNVGFRFRKSIKVAGIRFNFGKNGLTSASIGKKGNTLNISNKGTRHTMGINGTGISYSHLYNNRQPQKRSLIGNFFRFILKLISFTLKLLLICTIVFIGYLIYINL